MIKFEYKGYTGVISDLADGFLYGEVLGLNDVITFSSDSPLKLNEEFQKSVDEYLAYCKEKGRAPEKTHSGKFLVRINQKLHQTAVVVAKTKRLSLNEFVEASIKHAVSEPEHI